MFGLLDKPMLSNEHYIYIYLSIIEVSKQPYIANIKSNALLRWGHACCKCPSKSNRTFSHIQATRNRTSENGAPHGSAVAMFEGTVPVRTGSRNFNQPLIWDMFEGQNRSVMVFKGMTSDPSADLGALKGTKENKGKKKNMKKQPVERTKH